MLRRNIADSFVNLGRRNQNLLGRQLDFITELESNETDPDTLACLFRLDHLATRMRRNAESLLVLAGIDPPRKWAAPRAPHRRHPGRPRRGRGLPAGHARATSSPPRCSGRSAADLAHLRRRARRERPDVLAARRAGRRCAGGARSSRATGWRWSTTASAWTDDDIEQANRRLAGAESFTVAPSKYLGHYVAGNLAARHGVRLMLANMPGTGVAATIDLPPALLTADPAGDPITDPNATAVGPGAPPRPPTPDAGVPAQGGPAVPPIPAVTFSGPAAAPVGPAAAPAGPPVTPTPPCPATPDPSVPPPTPVVTAPAAHAGADLPATPPAAEAGLPVPTGPAEPAEADAGAGPTPTPRRRPATTADAAGRRPGGLRPARRPAAAGRPLPHAAPGPRPHRQRPRQARAAGRAGPPRRRPGHQRPGPARPAALAARRDVARRGHRRPPGRHRPGAPPPRGQRGRRPADRHHQSRLRPVTFGSARYTEPTTYSVRALRNVLRPCAAGRVARRKCARSCDSAIDRSMNERRSCGGPCHDPR